MSVIYLTRIMSLRISVIIIFIIYMLLYNIIWLMVIFESISAGVIIRLSNKYLINNKLIDQCMQDQEEYDDSEVSSVVAGVSDSLRVHHVHV